MNKEPQLPPTDENPAIHRVEIVLSYLLRTGVAVSFLFIVVGMALSFAHHPYYFTQTVHPPRLQEVSGDFPDTIPATIDGLRQYHGQAFIVLGLLLLIATPVMRVAASILAFAYQKDRPFVFITSGVLLLLLLSFFLGKAGG